MQKKLTASVLASFALVSCTPSGNPEVPEVQKKVPAASSETVDVSQPIAKPSETAVATESGTIVNPTPAASAIYDVDTVSEASSSN